MQCIPNNLYHLANVRRLGKKWDHTNPVRSPRLADAGIESIPFLSKQLQIELGFGLGTSGVDRFEVGCDLFHVLIRDVAQGVSHQMHHAQLHPRLRIDRLYGFG